MLSILLFIWQFPQNILGFILRVVFFTRRATLYGYTVYCWKLRSGTSLGRYILVPIDSPDSVVMHEHGHQKQSAILGWLYLIIIGIPSFMWAFLRKFGLWKDRSYYSFYPEKWADKLGHVKRTV